MAKNRRSRWRKQLRRRWRRAVFECIIFLARHVGEADSRRVRCVAWLAGNAALLTRPDLLRRDLANLSIALGADTSFPRRLRVLRASLITSAQTAIRAMVCVVQPNSYQHVLRHMDVQGQEHLDAALRAGGVVAVSAHLGDFARTVLWLAHAGYPITMTIREAKHVPPGMYLEAFRNLGIDAVVVDSDRQATQSLIQALKVKKIVVIYLDQDAKAGGIEMPFLGKLTPMPTGPAVLARRTGATLLPILNIDLPNGTGQIDILPRLAPSEDPDRTTAINNDTRQLASIMERYIRRYPEQWGWRYRRWRKRPAH